MRAAAAMCFTAVATREVDSMQIHTTARHCELDPEVRLFVQQRLEKFTKFARDLTEAHVIVTAEGYRHHAEISIKLKGREVVGREEATEPRVAIDRAADRIEQQLRRIKEIRVARSHGRTANGKPVNGPAPTEAEADADDQMCL